MNQIPAHRTLAGTFFAVGAVALVLQTLLIREYLVVFSGNELSLGVVFACWLFGVTFGAFAGAGISRYLKSGLFAYIAICCLLIFGSMVYLVLVRYARVLFEIPIGENESFFNLVKATFLVAAPAAFPIGFVFPIAAKLAASLGLGKRSIGMLYTCEASGATFGGVCFTYLLAGRLDSFNSLALFLIFAMAALSIFLFRSKKPGGRLVACLTMLLIGAVLLGGFSALDNKMVRVRWQSIAPGLELIENRETRYQNLTVGRLAGQTSVYGNGKVFTSFPDPHRYEIEANLIACQHPAPKTALIIGIGAEGQVPFLLKHSIARIDYLETDSQAMEMVSNYLPAEDRKTLQSDKVRLIPQDGRYFVRHTQDTYDLVILNLPDPSTAMINRFYTMDFFRQVASIMRPGAVISLTATSAVNYVGNEIGLYIGSLYTTLQEVFEHLVVLPGDTAHFFASNAPGSCTDDWEVLARRFLNRGLSENGFNTVMFKILMPPERIENFRNGIMRYHDARLNTDARPVTYFYNLILWDQFSDGRLKSFLKSWQNLGIRSVFAFVFALGALFAALFFLLQAKSPQGASKSGASWIIFTTGLAGMGLEMIVLMAFQNVHGALYEKIGLLVALFMLGLSLGGGWMTRMQSKGVRSHFVYLVGTELFLLLGSIGLATILKSPLPAFCYYLLVFLIGTGVGAQFPLAAAVAQTRDQETGFIAGLIDWADHLGAFFGAALIGIFLIPVFGLQDTCLIIAAVKAGTLITGILVGAQEPSESWKVEATR